MHAPVKVLTPPRSEKKELIEHGAMAVLLIVGVIQIVGAFNASSVILADNSHPAPVEISGRVLANK